MNFFKGKLTDGLIKIGSAALTVPEGKMKVLREKGYIGKEVIFGIRPEDIHDFSAGDQKNPPTKTFSGNSYTSFGVPIC